MKKLLIVPFLLCTVAARAQAPEQTFFPARKGAVLEYRYLDGRGKPVRDEWRNERWLRLTAEDVWRGDGEVVVNVGVENETFARLRGNALVGPMIGELSYGDVRTAADGATMENMQWLFTGLPEMFASLPDEIEIPDESKREMPHYRVELSATSHLPRELHVGDSLPDERFRALFVEQLTDEEQARRDEFMEDSRRESALYGHSFTPPRKMDYEVKATMTGRRVEALEKIATPAGEFECWKISYDLHGPEEGIVGMDMTALGRGYGMGPGRHHGGGFDAPPAVATKCVEWISPEAGLVRREKYNATGKRVEEVMELTAIQ